MHTAGSLLRNRFFSPKLKSSVVRNVSKVASFSRPVQRFYPGGSGLRSSRICSHSCNYLNSNRQIGFARYFSTGKQDEPPEEDPEIKDETPLFSNQLPALVAVPEVWPQVPVIAINRNPVFPRFIKLIEVSVCAKL